MKECIACIFCCLLPAALCHAEETPARAVKVPFELLKTQHIVVQVKINGKGPYRLIFDTGAPITLINNKIANAAGVIPKNYRRPLFAPFGSLGQFSIKTVQLGKVVAKDLPTVVMDHPTVSLMAEHMGPLEGIIGFSFFGRYRMTIDYQAKELTFVPTGFQPPDLMKQMMDNLTAASQKPEPQILRSAALWGFAITKDRGDDEAGVIVSAVWQDSPAASAGLKVGDRLLVLDDHWTDSITDTYRAAAQVRPNTAVTATICRDGKERQLTLRVKAGQ